MKASCGHCLREWQQAGNRTGHCGGVDGCHRTFSSATAFNKHQRLVDEQVICSHPKDIGLESTVDTVGAEVWRLPAPDGGVKSLFRREQV